MAARKKNVRKSKAKKTVAKTTPLKREFFLLFYPNSDSIMPEDVVTITNELKDNIKTKKEKLRLDLIIHSAGGDIYSAFKIINTIRDYCSELNGVVPLMAASAASLITLGADKIYLSSQSQLGPLDRPTEHPTIEGSQVSSIDIVRSIAYIEARLKSVAIRRYLELRRDIGLGRKEAAAMSYNIAVNFLEPLTAKLDPIQTSKASRDLQIAKIYGKKLLEKYMFRSKKQFKVKKADAVIQNMVHKYPSHGFAICHDEAIEIGLEVESSDKYKEWDQAWSLIGKMERGNIKRLWHLTEDQFKDWSS